MSLISILSNDALVSTTRIRIFATIGLIIATGIVYLLHACHYQDPTTHACVGWEPSLNWIMFLSALAGVDVSQYFVKSFSSVKHAQVAADIAMSGLSGDSDVGDVEEEDVTATSDVSEFHTDEMKG